MEDDDNDLLNQDPVKMLQLNIEWEPSYLIDGQPTEASVHARIYRQSDGGFVAAIIEHLAEAIETFDNSELHLLSQGDLMRHSSTEIRCLLGRSNCLNKLNRR